MRYYFLSTICLLYLIAFNPAQAQNQKPKPKPKVASSKKKPPITSQSATSQSATSQSATPTPSVTEYKTLRLLAKYLEEEKEGVHYFRAKDQKFYLVTFKNGLLYQRNQLVNATYAPPKDLSQNLQIPSPQPIPVDAKKIGYAIYVMDAKGNFYLSFEAQKGKFHHSSFLAGQPVACAGEMIIFQGKILLINNQSGHYQPPPLALEQALDSLKKHDIDLANIKIDRFGFDF
jgi:hypothetical protein